MINQLGENYAVPPFYIELRAQDETLTRGPVTRREIGRKSLAAGLAKRPKTPLFTSLSLTWPKPVAYTYLGDAGLINQRCTLLTQVLLVAQPASFAFNRTEARQPQEAH
jgi:hypothetical protein